ncbi:hypothetical protein [Photobacterium sanguinicancri]|uniref:hypothetical protein n=1 Tax=Photobacterium sanguinicancri TaxID=875932 RepID=UPI0021C3D1F6|nr:hypothetical protein [Photobacterium sanguinicancri]
MMNFKVLLLTGLITTLSGCTVFLGEPEARVIKFSDSELCSELADKTYKFHPEWSWAISSEIKQRGLDSSKRCSGTYNSRMSRLMRKVRAEPISFTDALNDDFNN